MDPILVRFKELKRVPFMELKLGLIIIAETGLNTLWNEDVK